MENMNTNNERSIQEQGFVPKRNSHHERLVQAMMHEIVPDYNNLKSKEKENLKCLVEEYLDSKTPEPEKQEAMNQILLMANKTPEQGRMSEMFYEPMPFDCKKPIMQKNMYTERLMHTEEMGQMLGCMKEIKSELAEQHQMMAQQMIAMTQQQSILLSLIAQQREREMEMIGIIKQQQDFILQVQQKIETWGHAV